MINDTLLIGYDVNSEGVPFMIIGRNCSGTEAIEIINLYEGKEATELYSKLIKHTNKEEK